AVGTLRHSACHHAQGDGSGKPRHAHVGGRKEGRGTTAEAHRSDDSVLPAGAVHRHSWAGRDQSNGIEVEALNAHLASASGSAVVDLIRSIANRDVTFFSGTVAISFL